jgi:hypothetical protein
MINRRLDVKFAICICLVFQAAPFGNTITVIGKRDIGRNPVKQRGRNDKISSRRKPVSNLFYMGCSPQKFPE